MPTEPAEHGAADITDTATDALQQQLVESLMAVIGAPDDHDVARAADSVLHTLQTRLTPQPVGERAA
ncbi:hypothetical protein [Streptomyces aureoverticillatus]|uniref:hypothetical protein n=1 Tax=Streptomyces aureoverticillatus TaxID=66871 RepID=UPI0013DBB82C|nr:hypothetical protein [Streptomyces aureoverticillatus]QIB41706.1 hypothetical protein G3H79_00050 [Streptomyces aureoverticillatus]QIB48432.1 hypothetical protein G3H79_40485 [Streptomyces aureoverticillatus]